MLRSIGAVRPETPIIETPAALPEVPALTEGESGGEVVPGLATLPLLLTGEGEAVPEPAIDPGVSAPANESGTVLAPPGEVIANQEAASPGEAIAPVESVASLAEWGRVTGRDETTVSSETEVARTHDARVTRETHHGGADHATRAHATDDANHAAYARASRASNAVATVANAAPIARESAAAQALTEADVPRDTGNPAGAIASERTAGNAEAPAVERDAAADTKRTNATSGETRTKHAAQPLRESAAPADGKAARESSRRQAAKIEPLPESTTTTAPAGKAEMRGADRGNTHAAAGMIEPIVEPGREARVTESADANRMAVSPVEQTTSRAAVRDTAAAEPAPEPEFVPVPARAFAEARAAAPSDLREALNQAARTRQTAQETQTAQTTQSAQTTQTGETASTASSASAVPSDKATGTQPALDIKIVPRGDMVRSETQLRVDGAANGGVTEATMDDRVTRVLEKIPTDFTRDRLFTESEAHAGTMRGRTALRTVREPLHYYRAAANLDAPVGTLSGSASTGAIGTTTNATGATAASGATAMPGSTAGSHEGESAPGFAGGDDADAAAFATLTKTESRAGALANQAMFAVENPVDFETPIEALPQGITTGAMNLGNPVNEAGLRTQTLRSPLPEAIDQITRMVVNDQKNVTIQLTPAHLGTIQGKIAVHNGRVIVKLDVDTENVQGVLKSSVDQLQEALQREGMDLQALAVTVSGQEGNGKAWQGHPRESRAFPAREKTRKNSEKAEDTGKNSERSLNLLI